MIVVSNTTPIISLSSIGKVSILENLFETVLIPASVYKELKAKDDYGFNEADYDLFLKQSIKGIPYRNLLLNQLDIGEADTIILAIETKANLV